MLLKVKYLNVKKHIKMQAGFTYLEFVNEGKIPLEAEQNMLFMYVLIMYVAHLFKNYVTLNTIYF